MKIVSAVIIAFATSEKEELEREAKQYYRNQGRVLFSQKLTIDRISLSVFRFSFSHFSTDFKKFTKLRILIKFYVQIDII